MNANSSNFRREIAMRITWLSLIVVGFALVVPASATHVEVCDVVCTWTLPPGHPDDIFRFVDTTMPISVLTGDEALLSLTVGKNCEVKNCVPVVHDGTLAIGRVVVEDCSSLAPEPPSDPAGPRAVRIRICASRTDPREQRVADLVVHRNVCSPRLVVRVSNPGEGAAPPSTTRVEVLATVPIPVDIATPAIPAHGSVELDAGVLPQFCTSGCQITLTADVAGAVDESDEENNRSVTRCVKRP